VENDGVPTGSWARNDNSALDILGLTSSAYTHPKKHPKTMSNQPPSPKPQDPPQTKDGGGLNGAICSASNYLPKAHDFRTSQGDQRYIEDGLLKIKFGADRDGIEKDSILTCWPWQEGDSAWHQDLGEGYPENTTTVEGVLFNSWGVLTAPSAKHFNPPKKYRSEIERLYMETEPRSVWDGEKWLSSPNA
jgi:hypothetical protein